MQMPLFEMCLVLMGGLFIWLKPTSTQTMYKQAFIAFVTDNSWEVIIFMVTLEEGVNDGLFKQRVHFYEWGI